MSIKVSDEDIRQRFSALGFLTRTQTLMPLLRMSWKAASVSDITVLLEGETGTGKQVLAYGIHQLDEKRKSFPFVTLHCGSISESLVESELFGHERGAFSGAISARKGLFQAANRGTLFLDDVNDLPISLQPRLLDVLQRGVVRAVGSDRESRVDAQRIVGPLKPQFLRLRDDGKRRRRRRSAAPESPFVDGGRLPKERDGRNGFLSTLDSQIDG